MTVHFFFSFSPPLFHSQSFSMCECVILFFYLWFYSFFFFLLLISNWWCTLLIDVRPFFVMFFSLVRRQSIWNRTDKDKETGKSNKHSDSIHIFFFLIHQYGYKHTQRDSKQTYHHVTFVCTNNLSQCELIWQYT